LETNWLSAAQAFTTRQEAAALMRIRALRRPGQLFHATGPRRSLSDILDQKDLQRTGTLASALADAASGRAVLSTASYSPTKFSLGRGISAS
jgi:hypothetical protein